MPTKSHAAKPKKLNPALELLPAIGVLPEHHALLTVEAEKRGITLYKLVQDAIVELIEDIEDGAIIEQRLADDDGVRYTLDDLKESNKLLNINAVFYNVTT